VLLRSRKSGIAPIVTPTVAITGPTIDRITTPATATMVGPTIIGPTTTIQGGAEASMQTFLPREELGLRGRGSAFIALSRTERDELSARLAMSKAERSPVPKLRFPDVQWVKPNLVARVRHLAGAK
jgi:hypothetical protein